MKCTSLLSAAALLASGGAAPPLSPMVSDDTVEHTVLLMRHGVRAPLSNPPLPASTTTAAWPVWPVGRAELTPHGFAAVRLVGRFDRGTLPEPERGCPAPGTIVVLADNDQRTIETGRAWIDGFAPGCGLTPASLPTGTPDPVFAPLEAAPDSVDAATLTAAVERRLPAAGLAAADAAARALLLRFDAVLCGGMTVPTCGLARTPTTLRPARAGREPALRGALAEGATAVQTLTLAYAEGMKNVGWGRLRFSDFAALGNLRAQSYALVQRTPEVAKAFGGPTLRRMVAALQPAERAKVTVLVGHDSNVASVAGLLDLHWQAAGFATDDPTPSGALGLQIVRDVAGHRFVRAFYRSPGLEQIRSLAPLKGADVRQALPIAACAPTPLRCPVKRFGRIVEEVLAP